MAGKSSKNGAQNSPSTSAPPRLHHNNNTKSIESTSVKAKRMCAEPDMEDYGNLFVNNNKKKKAKRVADTLLDRFRSKRGLFVTDVTKTEWCQKKMEFSLFVEECKNNDDEANNIVFCGGGRKNNEAMKASIYRHAQLQHEILEPVRVEVESCEDYMAVKLVNFINGTVNQLQFEGLTREIPIVSFAFAEGIWMVGKIDEIRMDKSDHNPKLVETKTRFTDTAPLEPQKRNGRIQLMCYKYLWDNLVSLDFPCREFYDYFELSPNRKLCRDLQKVSADSGFPVLTLDDLVMRYRNACRMLPRSHDELVLRYESQRDQSLLEEDNFVYDGRRIKREIRNCLEFWLGRREASFVAEGEEWKCGHCDFASECPAVSTDPEEEHTEGLSNEDSDSEESTEGLSSDDSSYYY